VPTPRSRRRSRLIIGALAVAAALIIAPSIPSLQQNRTAGDQGAAPEPTPSQNEWPAARPASSSAPPPVVSSSRGFLAKLDLVIFARSADGVIRIDTRAGRITRIPDVTVKSSGFVSFVAAPDRLIIRPSDAVDGFVVIDGQQARPLNGLLADSGQVLPAPRGRIWILAFDHGRGSTVRLTDPTGSRIHSIVSIFGSGQFATDRAGDLLYTDFTGSYQVTTSGLERVARGYVSAIGPRHYLYLDCDARYRCSTYLLDRRTMRQRRIESADPRQLASGILSADGRYVAMRTWGVEGRRYTLTVQDLDQKSVLVRFSDEIGPDSPDHSMVWLPDGRLLLIHNGRLVLFDPQTGTTVRPELDLPPLLQLAVRGG
jgi:hypothetical protein